MILFQMKNTNHDASKTTGANLDSKSYLTSQIQPASLWKGDMD